MKFINVIKMLIVLNLTFCIPGTQRDACRYNAQPKKAYCEFLLSASFLSSATQNTPERTNLAQNAALVECLKYYNTIEDCKKEENKYIPSIYGMLDIEIKYNNLLNQIQIDKISRVKS